MVVFTSEGPFLSKLPSTLKIFQGSFCKVPSKTFFAIFLFFPISDPPPGYCRTFPFLWGAVAARHTKGFDHPLPVCPGGRRRKPTRPQDFCPVKSGKPSGLVDFRRTKRKSPVPGWTFAERSQKVLCLGGLLQSKVRKTQWSTGTFAERSSKVLWVAGLLNGKAQNCARAGTGGFFTGVFPAGSPGGNRAVPGDPGGFPAGGAEGFLYRRVKASEL